MKNKIDSVQLSQDLLLQTKLGKDYGFLVQTLEEISPDTLQEQLNTAANRLVFWINIYNAFIQIIYKEKPHLQHRGHRIFTQPNIRIAHQRLSFDAIEHGILRHSQFKYGFGYIPKVFWNISNFEKQYRLEKVDPRIHFALNCGAASCPPIAFYHPKKIHQQLDQASGSYLETETLWDSSQNTLYLPKFFLWFFGDFGGKKGIVKFYRKYQIIPEEASPKIRFKKYNWTLKLRNFSK